MNQNDSINRRSLLKVTGVGAVGVASMVGCQGMDTKKMNSSKPRINFKNAEFYDAKGNFDLEKGKDAYIALMNYHGYPITPNLRQDLWVSDYGMGEFATLGLAAIGFINDQKSSYLGQDLFILPGQMLPQHYHLATAKCPPKMEGWHVRHGISYVYGEGEPTKNMKAVIPKSQMNIISVKHETILKPGETATLNRQTAPHWQFGGPEGAIVSEYGTFHDNDGVRHSDPKIVFP